MEEITFEVEVYNRNYPTWVDGLPLITTIERNKQYLHITREDCFGKPHSMQRDGNKTTYYIHGVEVSKTMWKEYIKLWKKIGKNYGKKCIKKQSARANGEHL